MGIQKFILPVKRLFGRSGSSLGIEITDHKIKMIELNKKAGNPPEIINMAAEKLPAGAVVDGKIQDMPRVILTLQAMVAQHGWNRRKVHMVASSQAVMVRFLKLPDIPESELKQVVDFEIKHHIHLPFAEPYYDFCKLNGIHNRKKPFLRITKQEGATRNAKEDWFATEAAAALENPNRSSLAEDDEQERHGPEQLLCDVMLVAAPNDLIEEYISVAKSAGLVPASVEIKALSLYRLIELFYSEEAAMPFLLVDVGESVTDLSIFHEGRLKITRCVSLDFSGGNEPERAAETDHDLRFLFPDRVEDDFHAACSDLAHELERLINFYRYTLNNREQEFHLMMLTGDAPRLEETMHYLEQRLNMKVNLLQCDGFVPKRNLQGETTSYSVPIGLALRER